MTASDAAAWWGAVVATLVFVWELFKWTRSGPRLVVKATPNMIEVAGGVAGEEPRVFVEAVNRGDTATVLTHLVGYVYAGRISQLLRRRAGAFAVVTNGMGPQLPFRLEPGARWTGGIDQADLRSKFGSKGYLRCGVADTVTGRNHLVTVRLADLKENG
jgi:hypothetical protein